MVNEVRGYLLSSQGQKVMVRAFGEVDKEFLPVAFYDLSMVVTVAQSIRDFVLFGDIMYSICFIGFQVSPSMWKGDVNLVGGTVSDDVTWEGSAEDGSYLWGLSYSGGEFVFWSGGWEE